MGGSPFQSCHRDWAHLPQSEGGGSRVKDLDGDGSFCASISAYRPDSISSSAWGEYQAPRSMAGMVTVEVRNRKNVTDPAESTSTFSTQHLLLGSPTLKGNVYPSQPRPTREPALAWKASCPAWPLQGTHFLFPKKYCEVCRRARLLAGGLKSPFIYASTRGQEPMGSHSKL